MKLERNLLKIAAGVAFAVDFLYLVARNAITDSAPPGGDVVHTVLLFTGIAALVALLAGLRSGAEQNPFRSIGTIVVAGTALLLMLGIAHLSTGAGFGEADGALVPSSVVTVIVAFLLGIASTIAAAFIFLSITELIYIKRRRNTRRNYILLLVSLGLYVLLASLLHTPLRSGTMHALATTMFVVTCVLMLVNAFRFSWILVLSRREKLINLLLSFFGFMFFTVLSVDATVFSSEPLSGGLLHHSLLFYHPVVGAAVSAVSFFGTLYLGLGFAGTLLHLPTAKEFDRRKVEIGSLQNLGRLVTQVFDFDDLVATCTTLALDVSEATAAWLELVPVMQEEITEGAAAGEARPGVVQHSLRGITADQIDAMVLEGGQPLQSLVYETGKAVVVHDTSADRRIRRAQLSAQGIGSLALIPLTSHDRPIGMLGVAKKNPYEFDKDALSLLTAFADMVAVALENNRLISESLVRERFRQEITVAQQMQRSLLPQLLPMAETYALAATSIPAYEVGGDYYDAVQLDADHLGFVIGDVSGKGVSAALYMAQVKGIFQTLSHDGHSTRDSLVRMNETLCKNMDRRSFISLIYAVLDIRGGTLRFSRAGHCPLLYISGDHSRFLRPGGMGLGLDITERFAASIEEEELSLLPGDLVVLYTDGVTEAKDRGGEEFAADRLARVVEQNKNEPVESIMMSIVKAVREYTGATEAEDDMTVMVLRWNGPVLHDQERPDTERHAHRQMQGAAHHE